MVEVAMSDVSHGALRATISFPEVAALPVIVRRIRRVFDLSADPIVIGRQLADDPLLTCRLPGMEQRSPVRIVLDRDGKLPASSRLAQSAHDVPLWIAGRSAPPGAQGGMSDAELSRLKKEFERMGEHPDDPVRQHLRKSLGQGPRPPVEHPPRHLRCAAPAPAAAPSASNFQPSAGRAPGKPAMPRQVQHEEYSQPLRASQRQWT